MVEVSLYMLNVNYLSTNEIFRRKCFCPGPDLTHNFVTCCIKLILCVVSACNLKRGHPNLSLLELGVFAEPRFL